MTGRQIKSPAEALTFMLAGKAVVTLKSARTGRHFTFKLRAIPQPSDWMTHFVSLRTGGPGEKIFGYMGYLNKSHEFQLGKPHKVKVLSTDMSVSALRYALAYLAKNEMPPNCEIWHEGACGRCGRRLTVPASIASGLGPECAGKVQPRCLAA